MFSRMSRTLREIHRLSREVPATGAAFEAISRTKLFRIGCWHGLLVSEGMHLARHRIFASTQVAAIFPANRK